MRKFDGLKEKLRSLQEKDHVKAKKKIINSNQERLDKKKI